MPRAIQRPLCTFWLLVAMMVVLSGCGGNDSSSSADHNDQDVAFATSMIPHHAQAVEMADTALKMDTSQEIAELARNIRDAQQPEINTMSNWLKDWGEPVPDDGIAGMDMSSGGMAQYDMPGMMTAHDMKRLEAATPPDFDRMWLQMMTEHHQGAIDMANTELLHGENADAKALARKIIDAQQAEIDKMQRLL